MQKTKVWKNRSRLLALLLALIMLVGLMPAAAIPASAEGDEISVKISYQPDISGFYIARSTPFDIAPDLSEENGFADDFNGSKVSALDAIVAAHIAIFGKEDIANYLSVGSTGFLDNFMGDGKGDFIYIVNGALSGVTAGETELHDGDLVELYVMRDWMGLYGDSQAWFELGGEKVSSLTVGVGESVDLTLLGVEYFTWGEVGTTDPYIGPIEIAEVDEAEIVCVDVLDGGSGFDVGFFESFSTPVYTDKGVFQLNFAAAGTYIISAIADEDCDMPLVAPWLEITVVAGTVEDPFLIDSQKDLEQLRDKVAKGTNYSKDKYFKLTSDITLDENWIPVGGWTDTGTASNAANKAFLGTLDGDGHTITFASGSKPLFGTAHIGAVIKNLNIYGPYIASNGLIDTIGATMTDVAANKVIIDNVTIKSGTTIKKSGLVGENGSYAFAVEIKNCTVEGGVKIGWDATANDGNGAPYDHSDGYTKGFVGSGPGVGSFVSGLCGVITGSVSYATVYGQDQVGGLVGYKAQSMRAFKITNSVFAGEIIATGEYVGGIAGAGYAGNGGANTPGATIENCYVTGTISGVDYVGGIFGGEKGQIQAWDNGIGYIRNNYFAGTIALSGSNVGGIIGYMKSINKYNVISNNYYLGTSADKGIGGALYVDTNNANATEISGTTYVDSTTSTGITDMSKTGLNRTDDPLGADAAALAKPVTAAQLASGEVTALLNSGDGKSKDWEQGEEYPVFGDTVTVYKLEITKLPDKISYTVGDPADWTGLVMKAYKTNNVTESLDASSYGVSIEGFDSVKNGTKTITITYGGLTASFNVTVLQPGSSEITVKFTLYGDTDHGADGPSHTLSGGGLTTWITSRNVTVDQNATVLDVFTKVLNDVGGFTFENDGGNYIKSITYNGVTLDEYTNGPNSGWMYSLNNAWPAYGVAEQYLQNGDKISFHYTDDYMLETGSQWKPPPPTGGDTTPNPETPPVNSEVKPEVTVDGSGKATSEVKADDVKNALDEIKKELEENPDSKGELKITAKPESGASIVDVKFNVDAAKAVADAGVQLTIDTGVSTITFDAEAIMAATSGTEGAREVTLTTELVSGDALTEEQKNLIGENPVFDLKLTVDGNSITDFGGGTVTVTLPYTPEDGDDTANLTVYYLRDDGTIVEMKGAKYDPASGGIVFTTNHFSKFFVGIASVWVNPFADVKDDDWFYGAVRYVSENGLMTGTAADMFSPDNPMTRAMLITVLYRCEGEPAVTAANPFSDVLDGQWYTDAIIWASANGIVEGLGGGLFGTNNNISREQIATILYRYTENKGMSTEKTTDLSAYTDTSQISDWAVSAMTWANAEGLITGRTVTTLVPQGTAARAEVATVIMRYSEEFLK